MSGRNRYPTTFSPITLNQCEIPNRIFVPALTTNMGENHLPGERYIDYLAARGRGGNGAIFMEGVRPSRSALARQAQLAGFLPGAAEAYRRAVEAVHAEGCKLFSQIVHVGRQADPNCSRMPAWGASPIPWTLGASVPHEMTHAEIREIVDDHVSTAAMLRHAGIDGIELHLGHGHLLQQFLSPTTNKRNDIYGGSIENRLRFALELFHAVREELGPDYPVGFRFSMHEYLAGGLTPADTVPILLMIARRVQMDFVHVTQSAYHGNMSISTLSPDMAYPDEEFRYLPKLAKAALIENGIGLPVLTVARYRTVAQAEEMLAGGHADMVGMGRANFADANIVRKSREGREDEIAPCIACNQGCLGRNWTGLPVTCMVNPTVGYERIWPDPATDPATSPKQVLVVGGGPAGLEAAWVAAARGHKVTLWERTPVLGGQMQAARILKGRELFGLLVDHQLRQCKRFGVEICLEREANSKAIRAFGADFVVFAAGSQAPVTVLSDGTILLTVLDALAAGKMLGKKLAVFDRTGSNTLMGLVEHLYKTGHEVTLVTPMTSVGPNIIPYSLYGLMHRLREYRVRMFPAHQIDSFHGGELHVTHIFSGEKKNIGSFDDVIAVENNIAAAVPVGDHFPNGSGDGRNGSSYALIGDCAAPRSALEAVFEGHEIARLI